MANMQIKDTWWMRSANEKLGRTIASRSGAYSRARWRNLRDSILKESPLCAMCEKEGKITVAEVCDHIIPITGEEDELFYDVSNIQPLCLYHHASKTKLDNSKYSESNLKRGRDLLKELSE